MLLLWSIIEAPTELVCDFKRFYQIDAFDLEDYPITYLATLTAGLHGYADALTPKAFDSARQWNNSEYLLAHVIDRLDLLAWQNTENGMKGKHPPEPFPRPGNLRAVEPDDDKPARLDVEQIKATLNLPRVPVTEGDA